MDYRDTPTEGLGSSPVQRLFGQRTSTLVPTSSSLLIPEAIHGVPHKLKERKPNRLATMTELPKSWTDCNLEMKGT